MAILKTGTTVTVAATINTVNVTVTATVTAYNTLTQMYNINVLVVTGGSNVMYTNAIYSVTTGNVQAYATALQAQLMRKYK